MYRKPFRFPGQAIVACLQERMSYSHPATDFQDEFIGIIGGTEHWSVTDIAIEIVRPIAFFAQCTLGPLVDPEGIS